VACLSPRGIRGSYCEADSATFAFAPKFHCVCCFFVVIWYVRKVLEIVLVRGYKWFVELGDPVYAYVGGVSPSERG